MLYSGGQGVHREVESEGHGEKYRAVINGGYPEDEPVGQRWGKVEPALWRRRRSHSLTTGADAWLYLSGDKVTSGLRYRASTKVFADGTVRKNIA